MYQKTESRTENGIKIVLSYPVFDNERIDKAVGRICAAFADGAKKRKKYVYHKLDCRVTSADPVSLLFEAERRGVDKAFSYNVLPLTFSSDGFAVPHVFDRRQKKIIKARLRSAGIRIKSRDVGRSYCVSDGRIYICAAMPGGGRAKRPLFMFSPDGDQPPDTQRSRRKNRSR